MVASIAVKPNAKAQARDDARLWEEYHSDRGDRTRGQLVEHYVPLLRHIVDRMARRLPSGVDPDDLMQEGIFGLMDAIDSFDPDRGVKFNTYAGPRIRGAILDYLRSLDWAPRLVRVRARAYEDASQSARKQLGRDATDEELAERLGVDDVAYGRIRRDAQIVHTVSIDAQTPGDGDDDAASLVEALRDADGVDPFARALQRDLKEAITRKLTRAERLIVVLYYCEGMTMREIGTTLDLSESRVSQMHTSIIARLKAEFQHRRELSEEAA